MKKLLTLLFAGSILAAAAQENPFEEFGYTPRIATLSGGKYIEYFDRDTIVQIGSIVYNTKSKKIVGFVEEDTAHSEATLQPDVVSRWISPDPLAYVAPGWTPYRFAYNNPIYWTDPTGLFEDNYTVDDLGNVELAEETDDDFDMLYKKDEYEEGNKENGLKVNDQGILPQLATDRPSGDQMDWILNEKLEGHYAISSKGKEIQNAFEYLAANTKTEWSLQRNKGGRYLLGTVHEGSQAFAPGALKIMGVEDMELFIHSHPGVSKDDFTFSSGDYQNHRFHLKLNPDIKFLLYLPKLTMQTWNEVYPNNQINYEPSKYLEFEP